MKNTPQLWDEIWKDSNSLEKDNLRLKKEENAIRWQRIERIVSNEFGSFRNLNILELGAGVGTYAALMAMRGGNVTILDYSEEALERSHAFFKTNALKVKYIKEDALSLPSELHNRYSISMSFGLAEHFKGIDRINIIKAHLDVLRKGGISFISVPNKFNPPYRIFKFITESTGRWRFGEEYPYSRKELKYICHKIGIMEYSFFGDSLISSFDFIEPSIILRKIFRLKNNANNLRYKKEKGTLLDEYLSYALVLCGKK